MTESLGPSNSLSFSQVKRFRTKSQVKISSYWHHSAEQDLQEGEEEVCEGDIQLVSYGGKRTKGSKKLLR